MKIVILTTAFLLLLTLASANQQQIENLLDEAGKKLSLTNREEAVLIYQQILEEDKTNLAAWEGLFYVLSMQNRYPEIIKLTRQARLDNSSLQLWRAYAKYMTADYIGSMNDYSSVLKENDTNYAALAGLGWNSYQLGYSALAAGYFEKSKQLNPHYYPAMEGSVIVKQDSKTLYTDVIWLNNDDIIANPSLVLNLNYLDRQLFFIYDYFKKDFDIPPDKTESFSRHSFSGGFRCSTGSFSFGANIYYLSSSHKFLYDARGILLLAEITALTPYFLLDVGAAVGTSEFQIGTTTQIELFGRMVFNRWALRPSLIYSGYNDKSIYDLVDNHHQPVFSLSKDYYLHSNLTLTFTGSIGEKRLLMLRSGYIIDNYSTAQKEGALSMTAGFRNYRFHLGVSYDDNDLATFYTGVGFTLPI